VYNKVLNAIALSIIAMVLFSCSYHPGYTKKEYKKSILESEVFTKNFTGFALYDVEEGRMVYEQNSDKYFTPASNIKLLTFYAGIKLLGDSVPALKYSICNDSLVFRGTGDPSFLNPSFNSCKVFDFLYNRSEKLYYSAQKYSGESLGPGWSWDWYKYSYFTEKAAFPIYGNVVRFKIDSRDSVPQVQPTYFSRFIKKKEGQKTTVPVIRDMGENLFFYNYGDAQPTRKLQIPFKYSPTLLVNLLSDTLKRNVGLLEHKKCLFEQTVYSVPSDSLYQEMLQESDNFIAEQLLLLYTSEILDSLNSDMAIAFIKDSLFKDFPDKPVWFDGSGLSRYNLITPRTMVHLLNKLYQEVPQERLFDLLPAGGVNGTLKDYYKGINEPYVYAKSGTLNNNLSLSGYLVTKKGRPMIFSFMHNNHVAPSSTIKKEMEKVLMEIHEQY